VNTVEYEVSKRIWKCILYRQHVPEIFDWRNNRINSDEVQTHRNLSKYLLSNRSCASRILRKSEFSIVLRSDVRGSNPGGGAIFRTCPDRSWGPPCFLYDGYRVFPGGKERPGCDADLSPPSSAVVMKE
jgi:hypothetical protein